MFRSRKPRRIKPPQRRSPAARRWAPAASWAASAAPITSRPGRSAGGCRFNILALARDLLPVCAEKVGIKHGQGFGINRGTCYTTGVSRAGAGQDHVQTVMAMNTYESDFLNVLATRGFIHQISDPEALDALTRSSTIAGYIGFDCTAPSLHVGSLLPIMMLYWMQQTGHRPIALIGSGTTRVGDPSGKDESRKILGEEEIARNRDSIRATFAKFLKFGDGPNDAIF